MDRLKASLPKVLKPGSASGSPLINTTGRPLYGRTSTCGSTARNASNMGHIVSPQPNGTTDHGRSRTVRSGNYGPRRWAMKELPLPRGDGCRDGKSVELV